MEYIGAIIFVGAMLYRGFKWVMRQTKPPTPVQAPPPSAPRPQVPFQSQLGFSPPPLPRQPQNLPQTPYSAPPPSRPGTTRPMPRQPQAGGPAVYAETDRRDFERQEQELFASQPTALDVSLASPSARSDAAPNTLFGGTDDLVRAIILQEVLGPPLSRRHSPPAHTPPAHTPR